MSSADKLQQELGILAHIVLIKGGPESVDDDVKYVYGTIQEIIMITDSKERSIRARLLVAPTGRLQDLSISYNWGQEFLEWAIKIEKLAES